MFSTAPPPKSPAANPLITGDAPTDDTLRADAASADVTGAAAARAAFERAESLAGRTQTKASALEFELFVGPAGAVLGKLSFVGAACVDGRVDGELLGGEAVVIGPTANVRGVIRARHVIVLGGVVEARIVALESVELSGTAKVHGDITAPRVEMEQRVEYVGRCEKRPVEAHELG